MSTSNLSLGKLQYLNSGIPENYILYAEDDPDDQTMLRETLMEYRPEISVIMFDNGKQLVDFLEGLQPGKYYPCLIILDMNMPMWDGLKTLAEIKSSHKLKHLKVLIFTTSSSARDKDSALSLGASGYVTKPVIQKELIAFIENFSVYIKQPPVMNIAD